MTIFSPTADGQLVSVWNDLGCWQPVLTQISVAVFALFTVFCVLVLPFAGFDANLLRIYANFGPDYSALSAVADRFGMFENDLLLVASSPG